MFARFINFAISVYEALVDFSVNVFDFMSYELEISFSGLTSTMTVFELMFGTGITVYLGFVLYKWIVD